MEGWLGGTSRCSEVMWQLVERPGRPLGLPPSEDGVGRRHFPTGSTKYGSLKEGPRALVSPETLVTSPRRSLEGV